MSNRSLTDKLVKLEANMKVLQMPAGERAKHIRKETGYLLQGTQHASQSIPKSQEESFEALDKNYTESSVVRYFY